MPRVHHVKKARKDNPAVKRGEPYYWWKFRYGGKQYSKTRPRQSQLTQSAYYGSIYSMQEEIEDWSGDSFEDFESFKEDIVSQVDDLRSETQDSLDNMPEPLQYAPTGELLQERIDALDGVESELDCIDEFDFDEEEFEEDDFDEDADIEEERAEHVRSEEARHESEFTDWLDDAKSTLSEALDSAIV